MNLDARAILSLSVDPQTADNTSMADNQHPVQNKVVIVWHGVSLGLSSWLSSYFVNDLFVCYSSFSFSLKTRFCFFYIRLFSEYIYFKPIRQHY